MLNLATASALLQSIGEIQEAINKHLAMLTWRWTRDFALLPPRCDGTLTDILSMLESYKSYCLAEVILS